MARAKKAPLPLPMTPEERRDFVEAYCNGTVTTSRSIPEKLIGQVFLPVGLGGPKLFRGWRECDFQQIGIIWADRARDKTTGLAVNGHPMFVSCRLMLRTDWEELRLKVLEELDRRIALRP